jgi:hypothetical protein
VSKGAEKFGVKHAKTRHGFGEVSGWRGEAEVAAAGIPWRIFAAVHPPRGAC